MYSDTDQLPNRSLRPRSFLAYVRVSTTKQGDHGVSLQEQRSAIERYAETHDIRVIEWIVEKRTAASAGRPLFDQMLRNLRKGKAAGVLLHKVDRSSRNWRDWAALHDLADEGTEVRFVVDGLSLGSNSERFTADVQMSGATNYIRNLRDEAIKGIYGRLKQGIYPFPAPAGYRDAGAGRPKEIDPIQGPLMREAFERYGSGRISTPLLQSEMAKRGLRSRAGTPLSENALQVALRNPFYVGIIRINKNGETYPGKHEPLISPSLFEQVQAIMDGRLAPRTTRHDFLFRRFLRCERCGRHLIGELQKRHVYYRCQSSPCRGTLIREDRAAEAISASLERITLPEQVLESLVLALETALGSIRSESEDRLAELNLQRGQIRARFDRLTDAFLDGKIEEELFLERKESLLLERARIEENLSQAGEANDSKGTSLCEFLELLKSPSLRQKLATPAEMREITDRVTSNRRLAGKNLMVELKPAFAEIARMKNQTMVDRNGALLELEGLVGRILAAIFSQQSVGRP